MTWFVFALIAAFFGVIYNILGRILSIDSENPRAFSVVYNTLAGIIVLFILFVDPGKWQVPPLQIIFLTLVGIVFYGFFNRTEFYSKKYINASTSAIIGKLAPVITFIASILFLKESINFEKIIAAILILGGTIIATYDPKNVNLKKGLNYTIIMCVSLGLAWTVDKVASSYYPLAIYAFITYLIPNIFVIFFPTLSFQSLRKEFKHANWKVVLLATVNVCLYYSLIKAFQYGEASKIMLVYSISGIFIILIGVVFLKERENLLKKLLAGAIVFIGVLLLK